MEEPEKRQKALDSGLLSFRWEQPLRAPYLAQADAFGMYTEEMEEVLPSGLVKEAYDLFLHRGMTSI